MASEPLTTVKDYLIEALFQLLKDHRYDDLSITDICSKAGVSRMSYYRHFNSKDELAVAYLTQKFEQFFQQIQAQPDPDPHDLWQTFFALPFTDLGRFQNEQFIWILTRIHERYAKQIFETIFHWDLSIKQNQLLYLHFVGGLAALVNYTMVHGQDPAVQRTVQDLFDASQKLHISTKA